MPGNGLFTARKARQCEQQFGREMAVRGTTARILCVIALALGLTGCDKCGNFFGFAAPYGLDVCKPSAPKQ